MSIIGLILIIIVLIIIVSVIAFAIRIVPQSKAYVVERIGAYNRTCSVGLHILVPFLDRVANKVSLKEQVVDFAPQPVITKDNVTIAFNSIHRISLIRIIILFIISFKLTGLFISVIG